VADFHPGTPSRPGLGDGRGIFLSYRRQESSHVAGRLYDRLVDRFGTGQVFIDVDAIEPGIDFTRAIDNAVSTCQVLLAVIGRQWLTATDEWGRRRLDDPADIVRLEIEIALHRKVRVIPILVEDAAMPRGHDLPESLAGLARRNAFIIRHESFRHDAERLVTVIEGIIFPGSQPPAHSVAPPAAPHGWHLELVKDEGATKTFRLSSANAVHEILVHTGWNHVIEIDGDPVIEETGIHGKEFPLKALSQSIGSDVSIRVDTGTWATMRIRSVLLRIGPQVLKYRSGIR
jgi:hypothetical protein